MRRSVVVANRQQDQWLAMLQSCRVEIAATEATRGRRARVCAMRSSYSSFAVRAMEARANEARVWLFSGL
jgi:hypothetical protein